MNQALYQEWFVRFRFPGHEEASLVPSALGDIPEGWTASTIADVAVIHRGRSYKSANLVEEGGLPFLNLKCIEREGGFRSNGLKRYEGPIKSDQTARTGDIIMAVTDMTQERRLVARAAVVPRMKEDLFAFSMDLVKIQPKDLDSLYLYWTLRFSGFADEVKQYANGANVLHLSPKIIAEYRIALPPIHLRQRFSTIATQTSALIDALRLKAENLRTTRDLLLPKLISGQIDVEHLDIDTGASPEGNEV